MAKEKSVAVEDLVASLRSEMTPVEGASTGNISLDHITSIGGYPRGRITEQFGPPSSGKTTSAMQAMALELQKCEAAGEGYVLYLDYEFAMDPDYALALGLDAGSDRFIYIRPKSFEEGADKFRQLMATGQLRMVIFDSVAAMVTESEIAADTGKAYVADRAKLMHQLCRQIKSPLDETGCVAVFINHTMALVDTTPMGQRLSAQGIVRETQPGGKALPFYASLRISFKQMGKIKDTVLDDLTKTETKAVQQVSVLATVVKNKVGDPFRTAELRIRFGHGFSQEYAVLKVLSDHKIVRKQAAGVHVFPEELRPADGRDRVQGENSVVRAIEEDPEWLGRLLEAAQKVLNSGTYVSVVETSGSEGELAFDPETGEVTF